MTWKNHLDIGLVQYRGEDWPLVGGFAIGFLASNKANVDWRFDAGRAGDNSVSLDVQTPYGGFYTWFRNW